MEIVVPSKNSLFQQKFHKKLYHFNRNSQLTSVMQKMIQLDFRSRTKKFHSDPLVLLGIRFRLHQKNSDSLRLRNPGSEATCLCVSDQSIMTTKSCKCWVSLTYDFLANFVTSLICRC